MTTALKKLNMGFMILFLLSCQAPRNNPLDPENSDYSLSVLNGRVMTMNVPPQPIAGSQVIWQNKQMCYTDPNGYFAFNDILPESGYLYFHHSNYISDSLYISLNNNTFKNTEKFLYSKPHLDSLYFFSDVLNKYPSDKEYQINIKCNISDADNNIDSVFIQYTDKNIKKSLKYNINSEQWEGLYWASDFNIQSIREIVGKNFNLVVKKLDFKLQIGQAQIKRVILDEIDFISPANSETVNSTPQFNWKKFNPGFSFTYQFEIYTNEIFYKKIWTKSNISSDSTTCTLTQPLNKGNYFWVIWCVDEHNNRARSKPASFTVQ